MSRFTIVVSGESYSIVEKMVQDMRPLSKESLGAVQTSSVSLEDIKHAFQIETTSVFILRIAVWKNEFHAMLESMRRAGYRGPVVIVSDVLPARDFKPLDATCFLAASESKDEILGVVRRLLALPSAKSRIHPRFLLRESVEVVFKNGSRAQSCLLENLSRGGACLEFSGGFKFKRGELIEMTLNLDESNEAHVVQGRIAWTDHLNTLAGVEFFPTQAA